MAADFPLLPKDKTDLEKREAMGLWNAIALARKIGESDEPITLDTILSLHKEMLFSAYADSAGRLRRMGENIKKLQCIEPPLGGHPVDERMYLLMQDLKARLDKLSRNPGPLSEKKRKEWRADVVDMSAWIQHQMAAIHPFCEGNGRMARLMTDLILRRYGFRGSQLKHQGDDKPHYINALCQIDQHGDYAPLTKLIVQGMIDIYRKERELRQRKQATG